MMSTRKINWMLATVLLVVVGSFGINTHANMAVCPMAGIAQKPNEDTCFSNSYGKITNICSGTRRFCVAPEINSSGWWTVKVTALRPNGGTLSCRAVGVDHYGSPYNGTSHVSLNVVDIDTQFTVGSVYVPSYGAAFVCCDLSTNARIDTVNFSY
jgi:hypothetical protein